MSQVFLSGFEAWGEVSANPSGLVASRLDGLVLPVDYQPAWEQLIASASEVGSKALLMLGLNPGSGVFKLETRARNLIYDEGELEGVLHNNVLIREHGPEQLTTKVDIDRIKAKLSGNGYPVQKSLDAGTFVCNYLYWQALESFPGPSLFLHLPEIDTVPLDKQVNAVKLVRAELGKLV